MGLLAMSEVVPKSAVKGGVKPDQWGGVKVDQESH